MQKSLYYKEFDPSDIEVGFNSMTEELDHYDCPTWLRNLFWLAWDDFTQNKWSYDGATFVVERYEDTLFEVAAFLHDWLNVNGIVSYSADAVMFRVMKLLKYRRKDLIIRWFYTRFTFLNIIRHKYINKTYKGKYAIELILTR